MPKFAHFKPDAPAPQPVVGWYDTDNFAHAALPAIEELIEVSEAQWKARLADPAGWLTKKGKIMAKEKAA